MLKTRWHSLNAGFLATIVLNGDAIAAVNEASPLAKRVFMSKGALVDAVGASGASTAITSKLSCPAVLHLTTSFIGPTSSRKM